MPDKPLQLQLLTIAEYRGYFEALAAQATFIDNFYYGYKAMEDGAKKTRGGTIMVLEPYTATITDSNADNVESLREGMFLILRQVKSIGEYADVMDACEKLAYKVIGRIRRHSREWLLRAEISGWSGHQAGPVFSQYVGYGIEFKFRAPINRFLVAEEGDWEEGFTYTLPMILS